MFEIGEYICYPMHGAGKVEAIEEREVLGACGIYYVLFFYCDKIKIMVPVEKACEIGLRKIIQKNEIPTVFEAMRLEPVEEDSNWNRRYRQNLDKLREGSPASIAEVLKSLTARDARRGLSAGEKKMLVNARRFLLGELFLAGGGSEEELNVKIDECISQGIV